MISSNISGPEFESTRLDFLQPVSSMNESPKFQNQSLTDLSCPSTQISSQNEQNDPSRCLFSDLTQTSNDEQTQKNDSVCPADVSRQTEPEVPVRKRKLNQKNNKSKKPYARPLPSADLANTSEVNGLERHSDVVKKSIVLTQKKDFGLWVIADKGLRYLTISSGGVTKKGLILFECKFRRRQNCKGQVQVKVPLNHIKEISKGNRKRFILENKASISLDDLRVIDSEPHSCRPLSESDFINSKIISRAKEHAGSLTDDIERLPSRGELVDKSTKEIFQELNIPHLKENHPDVHRHNVLRRVTYDLLKKFPHLADINNDNMSSYQFPSDLSEGYMKIDTQFNTEQGNKYVLFTNDYIELLTKGNYSILCDSTFPLPRKSIFEQLWIIMASNNERTTVVAMCWMFQRRTSDYEIILDRLQHLSGAKLWCQAIISDREKAQIAALKAKIQHSESFFCAFHSTDNFRGYFKGEGLSEYLPVKNKKRTGIVAKYVGHIWHVAQISVYLPIQFAIQIMDYLINFTVPLVRNERVEESLVTVLLKIKKQFQENPSLSWFSLLTKNVTPQWHDVTNNRLERLNGQIKDYLRNNIRGRKVIFKMIGIKKWADKNYINNLIFSHESHRKPSLKVRERRIQILKILYSLINQEINLEILKKVDEQIWELNLATNSNPEDTEDFVFDSDEDE